MPGRTQAATREELTFRLQDHYLLWSAVPSCSTTSVLCNSPSNLWIERIAPTTPITLSPQAITHHRFGLFPFRSPLLRESSFLSFPPATEMFHFAGLPPPALCVQTGVRAHYHAWVSPFGNPRDKGCSAPHRGLSQPSTSFIGLLRLGIHHML